MTAQKRSSEGSIYQLPSGHWRAQICIDNHRLSATRKTKSEAREWIREMQDKIGLGMTYEASRTTLKEFMTGWLATKRYSIRPATDRQYTDAVQIHILPQLGNLKLIDLNPKIIQVFIDGMMADNIGKRTIQIVKIVLSSCLSHAQDLGIIRINPAELVKVPKIARHDLNIWNEDEVLQFLESIHGKRNEYLYGIALAMGMRQGELMGLKWQDIDWKRETIMVRRQAVMIRGGGYSFSEPKSKHGWRSVDLGIGSMEKLRKQYELMRLMRTAARQDWEENDLVFPSTRGTPQSDTNLVHEFHKLEEQAGVPKIRFHDLRHTAASLMLSRGIPPVTVAGMLGHTVSVLLSTYAHFIPGNQAEAARVMDEITNPIKYLPR